MQRAVVTHASNEQLVAMGWDLGELARRYRRFIEMFCAARCSADARRRVPPAKQRSCCVRCCCTSTARSICAIRCCPARCCPPVARHRCPRAVPQSLREGLCSVGSNILSARVQTLAGALPPPAAEVFAALRRPAQARKVSDGRPRDRCSRALADFSRQGSPGARPAPAGSGSRDGRPSRDDRASA